MSVNFAKNQDEITNAWRKIVDEKDKPNWALYGYEGNTNVIRLMSTGKDGLASLVQEFNCSLIQYAFCRVIDPDNNVNKLILINWQGDSSPLSRKGLCASHVGDVANYFKGATQTITIRNDDETTVDYLMGQIIKSRPNRIDISMTKQVASNLESHKSSTSTNQDSQSNRKTDLAADVGAQIAKERKNFWQLQEEEEKLRLLEEKKRAAERQAQFEKERTLREQSELKKLAETVKERDRLIEATRNAERRESSSSNHHSISSFSNNANENDDDERVGRRSELIRLERNQETQSLISKGQIKNRRALFEKASQQETSTQPNTSGTLSRRSSGAMIKQRLDAFQSLDSQTTKSVTQRSVDKITCQTDNLSINNYETKPKSNVIVTSAIESVKLTKNEPPMAESTSLAATATAETTNNLKQTTNGFSNKVTTVANGIKSSSEEIVKEADVENGDDDDDDEQDMLEYQRELEKSKQVENAIMEKQHQANGIGCAGDNIDDQSDSLSQNDAKLNGDLHNENNNHITVTKSPDELQSCKKIVEAMMANEEESDKSKAKAVAIYDYQAADKTEISFDPNDLIGFIEKVDVGWWHGVVLTGKYTGQRGLFPHNHVLEL